ncbi:MAG: S9 family peptidase [Acidobacteria bacterium]|nr:S9 family peptidase [Acidobacteriota bacterium]
MAHPDWLGRQPERPYWSSDSDGVYFLRKREGEETRDLYRVDLKDRQTSLVGAGDRATADAPGGSWDRARERRAFVREADVFVRTLGAEGGLTQLTRTVAIESAPLFTVAGDVAFRRDGTWLVRDRSTGLVWQPFDVRAAQEPEAARARNDAEAGYLERQQPRLLEIVRLRRQREERRREVSRERQAADTSRTALPHYLGKDLEVTGSYLSPALEHLVLRQRPSQRDGGQRDTMPNYVTRSGMVEVEEVRMKVGTAEPTAESLVLLRRGAPEPIPLDVSVLPGIADDPLAALREAAQERKRQREAAEKRQADGDLGTEKDAEPEEEASSGDSQEEAEPTPRNVRFGPVSFNQDGSRAVVEIYSTDNKDRWIAAIDLQEGSLTPLHRITDPAWINYAFRDHGWLPDGKTLFFLSEETGYSHLTLMDGRTGERVQVTRGPFVVRSPQVSSDGEFIYFEANRGHPGVFEVYRVATSGTDAAGIEQLTNLGGVNSFRLSPDDRYLLIAHSSATRPPELWLQGTAPGSDPVRLTDTVSPRFRAIGWTAPRFVQVPSSHVDRPIHARLYLPSETAAGPRPAVVFVHGAGYLQNAHQGWSSYFREFMFHTLLTRRGYVVLDMDFRASAGYGRDWRTAIYRQMGTPELEDLADGVDYLVAEHDVDRERIGVYGGSYGGFVTFMAMFRRPELFAAGAALRPVTDWAHYNHGYTSNILNTPELDPEAYERSSPIEFAEGLQKPLLICAGMLDDNVLFQDSVRLVQRLIELGKENWELAVYPAEAHGFVEPSSWLDEYRRILKLFETHLKP